MARPPRADEAGGLYHALNRGNARSTIFHKDGDYDAFERIIAEGLERYEIDLLLSPWPLRRSPGWVQRVNQALTDLELAALRKSSNRGSPFGAEQWVTRQVKRLGLQSMVRQRVRPIAPNNTNNES